MLDGEYPAVFAAANSSAIMYQRIFLVLLATQLSTLIIASVLSFLEIDSTTWLWVQAICVLVSFSSALVTAIVRPQRRWYEQRANAESAKTLTWRFAMRAAPFQGRLDEASRELAKRLRSLIEMPSSMSLNPSYILRNEEFSKLLKSVRSESIALRTQFYLSERIDEQRRWYVARSAYNRRAARAYNATVLLITFAAIVFAILHATYPHTKNGISDMLITAAAAVSSWTQAARSEELATAYAITAYEIALIRNCPPDNQTEEHFSEYVNETEAVFSREHTKWQARSQLFGKSAA